MSELSPETIIQRVELPGSRVEDEMVFFDPGAGKYYATGPVGADVWEFLAVPRSVSSILDHILGTYDIDRPTCEAEVSSFLREILKSGLAVRSDAA